MVSILFLILLMALNAFFAASEMAFITLNDNKIKVMADDGDPKAVILEPFKSVSPWPAFWLLPLPQTVSAVL